MQISSYTFCWLGFRTKQSGNGQSLVFFSQNVVQTLRKARVDSSLNVKQLGYIGIYTQTHYPLMNT